MKTLGRFLPALVLSSMLAPSVDAQMPPGPWEIGPIIKQRNYSSGLPLSPVWEGNAWRFAISPTAEPHYVTFKYGSLRGKTKIRMRFRIDGPRGAIIHGAKCASGSPSAVTLYFQNSNDNWATDGGRWWATFASVPLKAPMAETEIVAPLNAKWTSVLNMTAENSPNEFAAAKANAGRVGFTFANCEGLGHGARASVPVRFVVTRFEVL